MKPTHDAGKQEAHAQADWDAFVAAYEAASGSALFNTPFAASNAAVKTPQVLLEYSPCCLSLPAVAAAAYRAGEKITNEFDGETHDYTRKGGVVHTEILPRSSKGRMVSITWACGLPPPVSCTQMSARIG